jgi:hypothetical protein
VNTAITPELVDAVSRLLALKSSDTATSFAIAKTMGYKAGPQAVQAMLKMQGPRPSNPYDVAFLILGAQRIQSAMSKGVPTEQAVVTEATYDKMHDKANAARTRATAQAKSVVRSQGPIVGWYAHYDSKTSPECRLANGNNFDAMEGTLIGYPGSVHPYCRCWTGPPHANGQWVNDVVQATPVGV